MPLHVPWMKIWKETWTAQCTEKNKIVVDCQELMRSKCDEVVCWCRRPSSAPASPGSNRQHIAALFNSAGCKSNKAGRGVVRLMRTFCIGWKRHLVICYLGFLMATSTDTVHEWSIINLFSFRAPWLKRWATVAARRFRRWWCSPSISSSGKTPLSHQCLALWLRQF